MIFNLPPICGLFPLLLYIVLAFKKGMHPLVNVSICAVVGAIMVKQPLNGLGAVIYESMGSFLALVGFIIMLGSGLGMVLRKTGVAAAIVNVLMRKIGVRTQKRAMIATMVCSVVLVTLLGKPCGVVINKETEPYAPLEAFCRDRNLPILGRIPYQAQLAQQTARGEIACETVPAASQLFSALLNRITGWCV